MRISIVGNGRLGNSLAINLKKEGHHIVEIHARNQSKLIPFCEEYGFRPLVELSHLDTNIDVLLISITDSAVKEVVASISGDFIVAHTSGSVLMTVFENTSLPNYGVFYPLYSFSKQSKVSFENIPLLIETNNEKTQEVLLTLAKSLSNRVSYCSSEYRERLHIIAVFVNNFVNYIWGEAQELSGNLNVDFDLLKPILMQTANRVNLSLNASSLQTGPAIRKDISVINKHLGLLENYPEKQQLYSFLTEMIQKKHDLK